MTPKSFGLAFGLTCVLTSTAFATPQSTVSAAIVFAVDRSTSVSSEEMSAQVKAHVSVLRSSEFVETAMAGDRCIGIHYMEWSGVGDVHPVLPWTIVCSRAKAEIAAAEIERRAGRPPGNATAYAQLAGFCYRFCTRRSEGHAVSGAQENYQHLDRWHQQ